MAGVQIRKKTFRRIDELVVRVKGAYDGTVTEDGPLVSDNHILFNRYFVRKDAQATAEALAGRLNGGARHDQGVARARLEAVRAEAIHEGKLLGHIPTAPGLPVRAEQVAGVRFRPEKHDLWRYVWLDAYRLRLLTALFNAPLRFFCAAWDAPVILKRGKRTVGCITPASPCRLDIEVTR